MSLPKKHGRGSRSERRTRRARPGFEALEGRRLMAAGISLDAIGVLHITGDGSDDLGRVTYGPSGDVEVLLQQTQYMWILGKKVSITTKTEATFPKAQVFSVQFEGHAGADTFANWTPISSVAYGGGGDDRFLNGHGNDTFRGEEGDDELTGGAGDDHLFGGPGDDRYIFAGANLGSDVVYEAEDADEDTLDFSGFSFKLPNGLGVHLPITLDLGEPDKQTVNRGNLVLELRGSGPHASSVNSIEDVIGTGANDDIEGNDRPNKLYGGPGDDKLDGYFDDDTLHGNQGNDTLIGAWGHDELYGGGGFDALIGGVAPDFVYEVEGDADTLNGGPDPDRLYAQMHLDSSGYPYSEDTFSLVAPEDVVLWMYDTEISQGHTPIEQGWEWYGFQWDQYSILAIDEALRGLVRKTGSNALLRDANGEGLAFKSLGSPAFQITPDAPYPSGPEWRDENGTFVHRGVSHADWTQAIQSLIGGLHLPTGSQWADFLALSGWKKILPGAPYDATLYNLTVHGGESWISLKTAKFASVEARKHPTLDFAETFAAYFAAYEGRPFQGKQSDTPEKFAFVNQFLGNF